MAVENTTTKMETDAKATSSCIEHLARDYKIFTASSSVADRNDNSGLSGSGSSPKCIFRLPQNLVQLVGEKIHLREPQMIAIGPYHHSNEQLKPMEKQKEEALFRVLHLSGLKEDVSKLVKPLNEVEQQLRACYDTDLKWPTERFIRMMLVDGCFLLDFLYRLDLDEGAQGTPAESKPTQLLYDSNYDALIGDIFLLENQIPLQALRVLLKETGLQLPPLEHWPQALHVLDIFRKEMLGEEPSPHSPPSTLPGMEYFLTRYENGKEFLRRYLPCLEDRQNQEAEQLPMFKKDKYLRSAKKLRDAGVTFKRIPTGLYGVRFHKGVLYLPELELDDKLLKAFVNLVALERMRPQIGTDITSFMCFMDFLIDTAEDVSFLGAEGIVKNSLESDEAAAKFFNRKLGVGTTMCSPFAEVQEKVRKYASADHHGWWVNLKDAHLANPWTILALIGSLVLLFLTALQTAYTVLTFYRSN